ncbi:hypothetical protein [Phormidesmis priestleyi]|uniref:hypothetical protein n=1 Tax=Phormidesmis priestleyi TaxID=268141 RepID=UPI0015E6E7F5|nr:hypothetical protein [Phormidesmis priestleyi]
MNHALPPQYAIALLQGGTIGLNCRSLRWCMKNIFYTFYRKPTQSYGAHLKDFV